MTNFVSKFTWNYFFKFYKNTRFIEKNTYMRLFMFCKTILVFGLESVKGLFVI